MLAILTIAKCKMAKLVENGVDQMSNGVESGKMLLLQGYEFQKNLGQSGTISIYSDRKNSRDVAVKQLQKAENLDSNGQKVNFKTILNILRIFNNNYITK